MNNYHLIAYNHMLRNEKTGWQLKPANNWREVNINGTLFFSATGKKMNSMRVCSLIFFFSLLNEEKFQKFGFIKRVDKG